MVLKYEESPAGCMEKACEILASGRLVILPTDTIYGISGIAPASAPLIYKCKGREEGKPFLRLIPFPEHYKLYTRDVIRPEILGLWPGPFTFILRGLTGGTISLRCPKDQWLRKLVENTGAPVFSTSVNFSGQPTLQRIEDIIGSFESKVALIIDKGNCPDPEPSTIVDLTGSTPVILRQGAGIFPETLLV